MTPAALSHPGRVAALPARRGPRQTHAPAPHAPPPRQELFRALLVATRPGVAASGNAIEASRLAALRQAVYKQGLSMLAAAEGLFPERVAADLVGVLDAELGHTLSPVDLSEVGGQPSAILRQALLAADDGTC